MLAARILAFARTIRWAIDASLLRKALAISGVVSPPSNFKVSATCDGGERAGWQQVKISRSWSSRTAITSSFIVIWSSTSSKPLRLSLAAGPGGSRAAAGRLPCCGLWR